jgi:hypothetical protein
MAAGWRWNRPRVSGSGKKYGNAKSEVNGEIFDSRKEARRYIELQWLLQAGTITDLQRQVRFELIPAQREPDTIGPRGGRKPGKLIEKEVAYIADFVYTDTDTGRRIVEDTKGVRTKEYIIKRKLMLYVHGIRIREI